MRVRLLAVVLVVLRVVEGHTRSPNEHPTLPRDAHPLHDVLHASKQSARAPVDVSDFVQGTTISDASKARLADLDSIESAGNDDETNTDRNKNGDADGDEQTDPATPDANVKLDLGPGSALTGAPDAASATSKHEGTDDSGSGARAGDAAKNGTHTSTSDLTDGAIAINGTGIDGGDTNVTSSSAVSSTPAAIFSFTPSASITADPATSITADPAASTPPPVVSSPPAAQSSPAA
ncbi:hypothetical protein M422DRAFT_51687 [Sphaerobolus stellatus SS14]|uniref:Uncharacterized protein n=1 Tax=Sphaerobolus stellatus (strain SS14) TaxID=990650 RepID=A0A0C9VCA7_SPHS4|nr:hypothetical protein M422DRAFT_51687 [Sphaerobolus stellatus SS14]